ncbi:hypothetical protein [Desulfofundulus thermosubterraneus]|uniref:Uncharacterized protein n=1 Tax=Desulfofundulus thermosubterraneus DSM 16057 TaxID=1121432 RepID=A0A1M6EMI3_9FIRM|nr:hypothetical protein [Desulfofundulus thermosubterraneus]SHI86626.1 hypothetical protein SAMN02745219_01249 [Desulfofundulus thermosubterraneus DSM 16057]
MIFLLIVSFIGIILLEVPGLVKKKMWRELVAFSVYLAIGMALSIPQVLGIKVPNPSKAIEALFKPLAELMK